MRSARFSTVFQILKMSSFVELKRKRKIDKIMEEDEFLGCISCMSSNDLYDLFSVYEDNGETYASMFKTCFDILVPGKMKFLCTECAEQLEKAFAFREQTAKNISMLQDALAQEEFVNEEYLDETVLEEEEFKEETENNIKSDDEENGEDVDDPDSLAECSLCGVAVAHLDEHQERCHGGQEVDNRKYSCHFCDNVYISKKACFTHLRMKHGLKLCTGQTTKLAQRERKKCHMCDRDFNQKQTLNKHLWKAHGVEVEKRKAFICPLCPERVSYGSHFSAHLLRAHAVREHVQQLQFHHMDDFLLFKSAVQEETKFRYRKTTASKQTIEGVRSHYMCSQSGVYVYQGKGKRPAPERQIYKTGKACPAHMIVTETMDTVLVTFYKTHVGHGPCPYFEPRDQKRPKLEQPAYITPEMQGTMQGTLHDGVICDACGLMCADGASFRSHAHSHALHMYACQYCEHDFDDIQAWTHHMRADHNMAIF